MCSPETLLVTPPSPAARGNDSGSTQQIVPHPEAAVPAVPAPLLGFAVNRYCLLLTSVGWHLLLAYAQIYTICNKILVNVQYKCAYKKHYTA